MAVTQNTYTGDGLTVLRSFTFPYLETTDVKVTINGTPTTAYTFANATTIQFNTAPANGVAIRIYRETDDSELSATFYPGSAIRSQDLNDNFTQNLYVTQEVNNNAVNIDGSTPMVGPLNMNGLQITNLPVPAVDTSAATKKYVDDRFGTIDVPGHTRWLKVATNGQTTFSGTGDYGGVLAYSPTREQVYINGALQQRGVDYAADNGISVVFTVGLTVGDVVDIICVNNLTNSTISNAANITYSGQFTGQATRTVAAKIADVVSVKDFGAVGNGVSNDTAAIQAALNYAVANSPCKVVFPSAIYKCNAVLGSFKGSNIEIDLQGSVLDFSSLALSTAGPLLEFAGTYDATAALTADAAGRVKTIAAPSTGFAVGDMVRIYSSTLWDPAATSTKLGELSFVESIPNGTSVNLTTETQMGYLVSAAATIQKLTPVKNVTIKNGTIQGPSGNDELLGLRIRIGSACLIENIKSYDVDKTHIQLIDCVFSKVTKCHIEQSKHSAQAYGVSFADACQDCTAVDNSFVDVRHSLSTNNNVSTSYGITRRILFSNNVVSDSATATGGSGGDAIDTHAGAEDIFIIANTVNSSSNYGVNFEARTGAISNNFIENTTSGGIYIHPSSTITGTVSVTGNTLLSIGDAAAEYGIFVSATTADLVNTVISNNRIVSFAQPVRVVGTSAYPFTRVTISGNCIQKSANATTLNGIEVTYANYASVTGNSVLAGAIGIILTDCSNSTITSNTVELTNTSGSSAWGIRLSNTSSYVNVSGNSLNYSASGATSTFGIVFGTTVTYSSAWSNITKGFATNVNVSTGTGNVSANNI